MSMAEKISGQSVFLVIWNGSLFNIIMKRSINAAAKKRILAPKKGGTLVTVILMASHVVPQMRQSSMNPAICTYLLVSCEISSLLALWKASGCARWNSVAS